MSKPSQEDHGQLHILQSGPLTLLQDLGRRGSQASGFCQSGALDEHAYLWANKLLDNPNNAALEITLGPFECKFSQPCQIAITGGAHKIKINGKPTHTWRSLTINTGDCLQLPPPKHGLRSYLAIQGGFHHKPFFNSAAMCPRERSGPFNGLPFKKNDTLNYTPKPSKPQNTSRITPPQYIPDYRENELTLHVIPWHNHTEKDELWQHTFTIHNDANRMAYKLQGPALTSTSSNNQLSFAVPLGSIQLPPDGQPIILMKDRQTIGGYPVLGCVTQKDLWSLGQMRAGTKVKFQKTHLEKSQNMLKKHYDFFDL